MANQFATNFAITSSTNTFNTLWKLSRVMKAAGWTYRASGNGTTKDTTGVAGNDLWGTSATPLTDTYTATGTFILAASNAATLPQATINVFSTTGFSGSGNIVIATSQGWQTVAYTGTSGGNQFTGCTGGTGTLYTGAQVGFNAMSMDSNTAGSPTVNGVAAPAWWTAAGPLTVKVPLSALPTGTPVRGEIVTQATSGATGELFGFVWDTVGLTGWASIGPQATPQNTTIASGSIGVSLPTGTINVASTSGFGSTGYIDVWTSQVNTTIAAGSNGATLPQATINVASTTNFPIVTTVNSSANLGGFAGAGTLTVVSTTGFPTSGTIVVATSGGDLTVSYTGTGATTFTGCTSGATSGTWTAAVGNTVNGVGTIYVQSSSGVQTINYTGFTGTSFTGCTGGAGSLSTGGFVAGPQQLQQVAYTGTSGGNQFTGCTLGTGIMMTGNAIAGYSATFDNTHTLTGGISGATMTPTGTITYYQREVTFGKPVGGSTNDLGNIFYIAADGYVENNQLFSTLAASVGCSSGIWPGAGGTNNTFSITSTVTSNPMQICIRGTGGSNGVLSATTSATWFGSSGAVWGSSAQIGVANAIPAASTTGDGSFYVAISTTTVNAISGVVFTRVDDCEPGDLDPYVWLSSNSSANTYSAYNRTTWTGVVGSAPGALFSNVTASNSALYNTSAMSFTGYQARGCTVTTRDVPYGWGMTFAWTVQNLGGTAGFTQNQSVTTIRLVSHPAATPPLVREPPLLFTPGTFSGTSKQIKGRPRWIMGFSIGNALDTFDNKSWIAVTSLGLTSTTTPSPCLALGPYDGITTPTT